ncbi:glucosaminidase domain-containing protein [Rhodovibrio salinarum]|uniref:Mannosyl-glycoprotein endo-beta-N-acetylglucosamidase-like domain-containing protein n=1 Tax=Rhodovibrio salinarum TaxID=1087 RepID=A0A934V048_9PROT|nr:glucosaminidase domain-containing protein [Rhodovibrio salinarum]MBK1697423.1 hypothetical protein [Rhodovibrio salinarum]
MAFPTRPPAAVKAVLVAAVLLAATGSAAVTARPVQADDAPARAPQRTSEGMKAQHSASERRQELLETDAGKVRPPQAHLQNVNLDQVRQGAQLVPQAEVSNLPARLQQVARTSTRKRLFIKTMLPAVLQANQAIRAERDFVEAIIALDIPRDELPVEMRAKLRTLADKYRVDRDDLETLQRRVDIVPPALVLAQAAIETGWGTSRFAQQGNALFGQHTTDPDDPGMVPRGLENPDFRVRTFKTVTQAVESYLLNLNTHAAYANLRAVRARARARGTAPKAVEMATGLADYSARGQAYVEDIRLIIRGNNLEAFAQARLQPRVNQLVDASSFTDD